MSNPKVYCSVCGGTRTTVTRATLDERYPEVLCSDCNKRHTGIREDAFNRRKWEAQKEADAVAKAIKKAGVPKQEPKDTKSAGKRAGA